MSTQPTQTDTDQPRDWHFTFGARQRFDGRYVTITGTHEAARAEMFRHFGNAWCATYDATRPAEVTKFPTGLTEMPRAEWPDSTRPTILTFGAIGIEPVRLDTPATAGEITEAIGDELTSAGYDLDVITLRFTDSGHAVDVLDDGDFVLGTVTISQPKPDCWLTLAEDLRQVADRIATLAGTPGRIAFPRVTLAASVSARDAEVYVPVVDAIATAFGTTAGTKQFSESTYHHSLDAEVGGVKVWAYAAAPKPEDAEKATMRAELETLRAQLAAGGTR